MENQTELLIPFPHLFPFHLWGYSHDMFRSFDTLRLAWFGYSCSLHIFFKVMARTIQNPSLKFQKKTEKILTFEKSETSLFFIKKNKHRKRKSNPKIS